VPGVLFADGLSSDVSVDRQVARLCTLAEGRLGAGSEAELAEIQAWRRAFSKMGLKPTQYRSASESLLRRFRRERVLPHIHPLIDLCNSASLAFAIPVAVFDANRIEGQLEVRYATGGESYTTFSGEIEHPDAGEVVFADAAGRAHARRWTNRQSGYSAVRDATTAVLIVAEAMHDSARADVERLVETLARELGDVWSAAVESTTLTATVSRFEFSRPIRERSRGL
jgi:DNA/RNA-binding domain of Phe-tRNA-synthetase-like protein